MILKSVNLTSRYFLMLLSVLFFHVLIEAGPSLLGMPKAGLLRSPSPVFLIGSKEDTLS